MNQQYERYDKWECYLAGMWDRVDLVTETEMLQIAIEFTGNHVLYGIAMRRVINEWKYCLAHHLTDLSINRKAYIGHCAVCLELGIPEYITRKAWAYLTEEQRNLANQQAENTIKEYETRNKELHQKMGRQMLLFGDS